jgi:hypothetical protein
MSARRPVSPAPGPLEAYYQHLDPLFSSEATYSIPAAAM